MSAFITSAGLVFSILLPGLLAARIILDDGDLFEILVTGTALGLLTVPLISFEVSLILGTVISKPLVLIVSGSMSVLIVIAFFAKHKNIRDGKTGGKIA